jgi:ADP-ribose pyrophosphatase
MTELKEDSLHSEQLVDGKLLKAYRDKVRLSNGSESVREWIDHPGASAVVPIFEDGTTVLIRQFRFPPRQTFIEVPAGKLDKEGQSPEEVAYRELEEETGWKASRMTTLGSLYPCIGYSNEVIHFFLAEGLTRGQTGLEEGEMVEPFRLAFKEAVTLAKRGEILDMKSAAALMLADAFLRDKGRSLDWEG